MNITRYADTSIEDRGSIDPATRGVLAEDYEPPSTETMGLLSLMAIRKGTEPEESRNGRAKIGMYASRPATEVLRDYIRRFETLEWVRGFGQGDSLVSDFAVPFIIFGILFTDLCLAGWVST